MGHGQLTSIYNSFLYNLVFSSIFGEGFNNILTLYIPMLGYQESQLRYKLLLFDFAQSYFLVNMTINVFQAGNDRSK